MNGLQLFDSSFFLVGNNWKEGRTFYKSDFCAEKEIMIFSGRRRDEKPVVDDLKELRIFNKNLKEHLKNLKIEEAEFNKVYEKDNFFSTVWSLFLTI